MSKIYKDTDLAELVGQPVEDVRLAIEERLKMKPIKSLDEVKALFPAKLSEVAKSYQLDSDKLIDDFWAFAKKLRGQDYALVLNTDYWSLGSRDVTVSLTCGALFLSESIDPCIMDQMVASIIKQGHSDEIMAITEECFGRNLDDIRNTRIMNELTEGSIH